MPIFLVITSIFFSLFLTVGCSSASKQTNRYLTGVEHGYQLYCAETKPVDICEAESARMMQKLMGRPLPEQQN